MHGRAKSLELNPGNSGKRRGKPMAHTQTQFLYTLLWRSPTHSGRGYLWPETSVREVQRGQYYQ